MKKSQYIIAAACILLGAAGFVGVYALEQSQKNETEITRQQTEEEPGSLIDIVDLGDIENDKNDEQIIPSIDTPEEVAEGKETELADMKI